MKSLLCAVVVCLFSVACDKGPTSPTAPTTPMMDPPVVTPPVVTPPSDFVGRVAIPINPDRNNNQPVSGVTVTILAGLRSDESVQTDHDGRYVIPDFDGDELHIRLKKPEYETKEVTVHRMKPTEVSGQGPLGYQGPQQTPGTVLIGLKWPEKIKRIMRQMPVVPDLLLILFKPGIAVNRFGSGVVAVNNRSNLSNMRVLAHEVCHAHQQWIVAPQGKKGGSGTMWPGSPEGQAYELARQADWREVGKSTFDLDRGTSSRLEGAAETCARWWDVDRRPEFTRAWLRVNAPNRARWAKDRLPKR